MCATFHRIVGLGRYYNVTPRWGNGFKFQLTRARTKLIRENGYAEKAKTMKEIRDALITARPDDRWVMVYANDGRFLCVLGNFEEYKTHRRALEKKE